MTFLARNSELIIGAFKVLNYKMPIDFKSIGKNKKKKMKEKQEFLPKNRFCIIDFIFICVT